MALISLKSNLQEALEKLEGVTENNSIRVVAVSVQEWQFTMEERITRVEYLIKRQQELLELL
ncbi:MAG: hypothetical protein RID53_03575 [Coleofasciculus sp. B1-GNL1-01]|uniref:hypothetical protein n=1 Tax=Coleofasciculus sp. B1-GNL1-01 TaxID=3068484 RepID=UPI0032F26646